MINYFRCWTAVLCLIALLCQCRTASDSNQPPNILWITIEDLSPMLGCYDDPVARSPNIDRLAKRGVKYTNAFATAAVCAPARSCLVTGVLATTLGTQHLRSETLVPEDIKPFPKILRSAGYYCSNNEKEDYNFESADIWDDSSDKAHWRNRRSDQPFFAVFNLEITHQSKIFGSDSLYNQRIAKYAGSIKRTRPEDVRLPSYFFDSPEIRKLWARYYDNVQIVDIQIQEILDQLKEDGLEENTIVFFYSDHGTGMPRGKRALYDSGLKVPLIISAPERYQDQLGLKPNTETDRLVSFVDFAPTVLNILDIPIPDYMQGKTFLGKDVDLPRKSVFATSDRVDEAYEAVRSVRTKQFRYNRNFYPQYPLIQANYYSDKSEIMKELYRIKDGKGPLTEAQETIWKKPRPLEELYHIALDPEETNNLALDPAYSQQLAKMRSICVDNMKDTRDSGLAPEAYMYQVSDRSTPYETLQDTSIFPISRILAMLQKFTENGVDDLPVHEYLSDQNPLINTGV